MKRAIKQALAEYEAEQTKAKEAKTIRNHGGGYLRFGLNFGYAFDRAELGQSTTRSQGFGSFLDFAVGINLSKTLVYALGMHTLGVFSPTTEVDGEALAEDHTDLFMIIGILLDYYPDPRRGLHFSLTIGSGSADINPREDEDTETGIGLAPGAGYDFWIGEQWSMGPTVRLLYIVNVDDDFGSHRAVIPTVALTALYH